jgi:hypothetical protein
MTMVFITTLSFHRFQGTPISSSIYMGYTMYFPCICRPDRYPYYDRAYSDDSDIHASGYTMYYGISRQWSGLGYTWYIHGYPCISRCIYHVYPWILVYMAYQLMYIHGIYVVYTWIFLSVLKSHFNRSSRDFDIVAAL